MKKKNPKTEIDPSLIDEALECIDGKDAKKKPAEEKTTEPSSDKKEKGQDPAEVYDRLVRITADFDNFRKRTQKEKAEMVRYSNEHLVRGILPILDNFERAVEHSKKATDIESIRTGVDMIFMQLKETLERFGVKVRPALGETFDPLVHEAVSHIHSDEHADQEVMEEHQKAYFLHDRLIRPALVTVSKGPEESQNSDAEAKTDDKLGENTSDESGSEGTSEE